MNRTSPSPLLFGRGRGFAPLLALLALVAPSSAAPAGDGLVTIGLGTHPASDGTFDAAPGGSVVAALTAAVDQLRLDGQPGGEIRFLPGDYLVDAPVVLPADAAGITLSGQGAILRASTAASGSLITILAPDVELARLSFRDLAAVDGRRFVDVRAGGLRVTDVEFRMARHAGTPVAGYEGLRVHSPSGTLASVRISGSSFLFGNPSSGAGGSAEDVVGIAIEDVERVHISANRFAACEVTHADCGHGGSPVGNGMLKRGIQVLGGHQVQISANSFTGLGWVDALVDGTIYVKDSGRVSIHGNYLENNVADFAVQVLDSDRVSITGNGLGRGYAGILVEGSAAGEGRTIIQTNEIHAYGFTEMGLSITPIVIRRRNGVTLSGNKFGLCRHGQVLLEDCEETSLVGNQFQSDDLVIGEAAIQIQGGRRHFMLNNTAHNTTVVESWPLGVLDIQAVQPCDYFERHNNLVNPRR